MLNSISNILFDLDGTIVNSLEGIQKAFDKSYMRIYGIDNIYNIKSHIGPPVKKIFEDVTGEQDGVVVENFITCFKQYYDSECYKLTALYEGIQEVLISLKQSSKKLFIVTNKRFKPTVLILKYLDIYQYFEQIYCPDNPRTYQDKCATVHDLLLTEKIAIEKTVLVGDTQSDKSAADKNSLTFLYASYGFGKIVGTKYVLNNPLDMLSLNN